MKKKLLPLSLLFFLCNSLLYAGWEDKSFELDGRKRDYRIYTPKDFSTEKEYALIVGIHGLGDDMTHFSNTFRELADIADTADIILVYPQGLENFLLGRAWNAGAGVLGVYPSEDVNDVAFINAVTDSMQKNYPVDKERTYLFGFSNGGYMVQRMACESNGKFAAFASIAGTYGNKLPPCNPGKPIPILHLHGTTDINVGYYINLFGINVDDLMKMWQTINECDTVPLHENIPNIKLDGYVVEHFTYQNCKKPLELFKVNNALHVILQKATNDIGYSEEIWRFFRPHALNEHVVTSIVQTPKGDIKVFPIPAQNTLTVDLSSIDNSKQSDITVFELTGRVIMKLPKNISGIYNIDCSTLSNGAYLLNISTDDYHYSEKFIVKH